MVENSRRQEHGTLEKVAVLYTGEWWREARREPGMLGEGGAITGLFSYIVFRINSLGCVT